MMSGCEGRRAPGNGDALHIALGAHDTLVAGETGMIGEVGGMAVDGDGRLWISDRMNHRVVVMTTGGQPLMEVGREGRGPGEFRMPSAIAVSDSGVFVFDFLNRRIVGIGLDGRFASERVVTAPAFFPLDVNGLGEVALPTLGMNGSLALVVRRDDAAMTAGTPRAGMPASISRQHIREQTDRGEVPVEFRNNVLPVLSEDGGLWLVHQSDGALERYGPDGGLLHSGDLPADHVAAVLERFLEAWQGDVQGVPVPWMARVGRVVQDELWLLVDAAEGDGSAVLVIRGDDGVLLRRYVIPGIPAASSFAVDPGRGHLFLAVPDDASILRVTLPGAG